VALEAKLWLVRPLGFRVDEATLRRAGLDYWQYLQWQAVDNWDHLLRELPENRFWYFSKTAERSFTDATFGVSDALVFGSETAACPVAVEPVPPTRCGYRRAVGSA
jgi:tRNA (cytidine/uridine-2'-O-)-methyltransferase